MTKSELIKKLQAIEHIDPGYQVDVREGVIFVFQNGAREGVDADGVVDLQVRVGLRSNLWAEWFIPIQVD